MAKIAKELCENCGRVIGKLETPNIWKEHVVCETCYSNLSAKQRSSQSLPERPPDIPDESAHQLPYATQLLSAQSKSTGRKFMWIGLGVVCGVVIIVVGLFAWASLSRPKSRFLSVPLAAPVTPQSTDIVSVKYDKFKDSTEVSVGAVIPADDPSQDWRLQLSDDNGDNAQSAHFVIMSVSYAFPGRTMTTADCGLCFLFDGPDVKENTDVTFLVDGQRRFGFVNTRGQSISNSNGGWVTFQDAQAISHAQSVEVQIGGVNYKLKPNQQSGVASLLKQIGLQ